MRVRKIKNSFKLKLYCGYCKSYLLTYQKVGKGGLLRLYIDRIESTEIPLNEALTCNNCNTVIANLVVMKDKTFYKMQRGKYNIKRFF